MKNTIKRIIENIVKAKKANYISMSANKEEHNDPRPQELINLPSTLIRDHISVLANTGEVILYEPYYSKSIRTFFKGNYVSLINKGLNFISFNESSNVASTDLIEYTQYHFPNLKIQITKTQITSEDIHELIIKNSLIKDYFGLHEVKKPCLISLKSNSSESKSEYNIFYLPESVELLKSALDYFISTNVASPFKKAQFSKSRKQGNEDIQENDIEISKELSNQISIFIYNNQTKGAISLMSKILLELHKNNYVFDDKTKKIADILAEAGSKTKSRLLIKLNGDIELIDYAIKIKLTPLQKVAYHLFLNHEDGILFKNLIYYKDELISLYNRFSNKSDLKEMEQNINELVNPFTNSMSEKCSRIKEAFLKQIDETIANDYIIRGGRGDYKKISLDRSLIIYEKG